MSPAPPPRPALSPPEERAAPTRTPRAQATRKPSKQEPKTVELVVPLPKDVRKKVREKAAAQGVSAEEAVYRLLLSWVEG